MWGDLRTRYVWVVLLVWWPSGRHRRYDDGLKIVSATPQGFFEIPLEIAAVDLGLAAGIFLFMTADPSVPASTRSTLR